MCAICISCRVGNSIIVDRRSVAGDKIWCYYFWTKNCNRDLTFLNAFDDLSHRYEWLIWCWLQDYHGVRTPPSKSKARLVSFERLWPSKAIIQKKNLDAWNFCKEIHYNNGGGNLHFRWENLEKRNLSVAIFFRFTTFLRSNRSIFLTFTKVNIFFLIHNKCRDYFYIIYL